jgi:hypothetical protein
MEIDGADLDTHSSKDKRREKDKEKKHKRRHHDTDDVSSERDDRDDSKKSRRHSSDRKKSRKVYHLLFHANQANHWGYASNLVLYYSQILGAKTLQHHPVDLAATIPRPSAFWLSPNFNAFVCVTGVIITCFLFS